MKFKKLNFRDDNFLRNWNAMVTEKKHVLQIKTKILNTSKIENSTNYLQI